MNKRMSGLVISLVVALPLLAAEKLIARVGMWENVTITNLSGLSVPADTLAKVPAAQRAQVEQAMRQMGGQGPRTITGRSCITEQELAEGAFRKNAAQADRNCTFTVIASTSKHQETTFACAANATSGHMVIDAIDDTHVKGAVEMKTPQGNIDVKFESKWLGPNCADLK